ncbi:MAG: T9SS type A sorting domain-containing protein [Saprospiraceae bacterium]|nr:T9SS type A sorting domain-containing protein [Saprospiraceae bacterium]
MQRNLYILLFSILTFSFLATSQLRGNVNLAQSSEVELYFGFPNPDPGISIAIFPNPTTDYFKINSNRDIQKVVVFNLIGRELRSFDAEDDSKYSVGDLPNGMYLIQLVGANNKILTTQRLQKK